MRKAVVDVGSNSVLLVVEERREGVWRPVFESSEVTGLGEGTRDSGMLGEEPMARTLAALRRAWVRASAKGVAHPQAGATMAVRIARNRAEFLRRAEAQGTPFLVLTGEEEAQLGFLSVALDPCFAQATRLSIVDVGGHSTELVTAEARGGVWTTKLRRSLPIGTLGLVGGGLCDDVPGPALILRACQEIDDAIGSVYMPGEAGEVVTLGATGTNLASIREGLSKWEPARIHGTKLALDEISAAAGRLFGLTIAERALLKGIEHGRERTLLAGALILERALIAMGVEGCKVSVRGWRHALLELGLGAVRKESSAAWEKA
ncbi:MAG: hypothetical protein HYR64_00600 [Fimbriimonas ginsengisoli]|uniref:Ppx/GppA phosphatase N-terminal domain-containing protein n=1 Tax=Fimbriimonas ginsengisoli TaxID=1005039 RepID=A0A931LYN9_FIMGI|nr:hypothetical protein [Fimbriimonas ginsengisoli]